MSVKSQLGRKTNFIYTEHHLSVLKCLKSFYKEEQFLDLVFISKDNFKVKAHKFVVASCSDFLKSIILESVQDTVCIILPDIEYSTLKVLVDFIYSGYNELEYGMIPEVTELLTLLSIKPLHIQTTKDLDAWKNNLGKENNKSGLNISKPLENIDISSTLNEPRFENPPVLNAADTLKHKKFVSQVNKNKKRKNNGNLINPFELVDGILNVPDLDFCYETNANTSMDRDIDVENIQFTKLQNEALNEVYKIHKSPSRSIQESLAEKFGVPLKTIMLWFGKKRIDEAVGHKESFRALRKVPNNHNRKNRTVKSVTKTAKKTTVTNNSVLVAPAPVGDKIEVESSLPVAAKKSDINTLFENMSDLIEFPCFKRKHRDLNDTVSVNKIHKSSESDNDDISIISENLVSRVVNDNQSVNSRISTVSSVVQGNSSKSAMPIMTTLQNSVTIYRCTICEEMLVTENELQEHFTKVHSSSVHQCRICSECFLTKHNLLRHYAKHPVGSSAHSEIKQNKQLMLTM